MEMNKAQVLVWFKEFKHSWLPETISKDTHLLELIIHKLGELERLLKLNNHDENATNEPIECSLFTSLEILSQKYDEKQEAILTRPAIRIKRIPLVEAERYMPSACKPMPSKRGRKSKRKLSSRLSNRRKSKKNIQKTKASLSNSIDGKIDNVVTASTIKERTTRSANLIQLPSTSSLASTQSLNEGKKQSKRKLRALDAEDDDLCTLANLSPTNHQNGDMHCDPIPRYMGQNGILSQTRKNNETSTMIDNDFPIKFSPRKSKAQDSTLVGTLTVIEDTDPTVDEPILQQVIDNNDNESLFSSLNITHDRTFETSSSIINNNNNSNGMYNDGIEDISNDGIDPPSSRSLATVNLSNFPLIT